MHLRYSKHCSDKNNAETPVRVRLFLESALKENCECAGDLRWVYDASEKRSKPVELQRLGSMRYAARKGTSEISVDILSEELPLFSNNSWRRVVLDGRSYDVCLVNFRYVSVGWELFEPHG